MIRTALSPIALVGLSSLVALAAPGPAVAADDDHPVVVLDTTLGPITIALDRAKAPITVDNFLKYVDKGFYDGVVFHRVIPDFMVQTGGMTEANGTLAEKPTDRPIKNESGNGLSNTRGSVAMARKNDPDSATAQFYINHADNANLDTYGGGYTVFGKVIGGMDVVDAIAKSETVVKRDDRGRPVPNVPATPILIKSAKRKSKS